MSNNELYALIMDIIKKYGEVQFNLGQLNMINQRVLDNAQDCNWAEVRRTARANSEAAVITLDETVRLLCGLEQQPGWDADWGVLDS